MGRNSLCWHFGAGAGEKCQDLLRIKDLLLCFFGIGNLSSKAHGLLRISFVYFAQKQNDCSL